jgi:hypothetical protein
MGLFEQQILDRVFREQLVESGLRDHRYDIDAHGHRQRGRVMLVGGQGSSRVISRRSNAIPVRR